MDTSFLKHTLDKYTNGTAVTWKATAGIFYVVWYRFVIYSVPLQFWWWLGAQPVAPRYFGNWAQRRGLFWYHLLSCRWKGRVFFYIQQSGTMGFLNDLQNGWGIVMPCARQPDLGSHTWAEQLCFLHSWKERVSQCDLPLPACCKVKDSSEALDVGIYLQLQTKRC